MGSQSAEGTSASSAAIPGTEHVNEPVMADIRLPRIAIATGDPAGIGPEISLKAALDAQVRQMCRPLVVGDPMVLKQHAASANITAPLHVVATPADADWNGGAINVLPAPMPERVEIKFGTNDAAYGRATLASCSRAIRAALDGDVDAVVAAPQNQASIAAANIAFDGLSDIRRPRNRDEPARRFHDAVVRRHPHRARHAACQRRARRSH